MYRFGAFITPFIINTMTDSDKADGALGIYAALAFSAAILMLFMPFE